MSYDFAVLTPEAAGASDRESLDAAQVLFDQEVTAPEPDRRLADFLVRLEAAGAVDEDTGWVSVWPLDVYDGGVAVPTTYADVDSNLVTLLWLAAEQGLVLVDLSTERVHPPAPGQPVGVIAGDGSRLGALTRERLESLLADLPRTDPWLVLERERDVYVQTYRQDDGTFLLERRGGSADRHFRTILTDRSEVADRMWAWLSGEPGWSRDITWERVTL